MTAVNNLRRQYRKDLLFEIFLHHPEPGEDRRPGHAGPWQCGGERHSGKCDRLRKSRPAGAQAVCAAYALILNNGIIHVNLYFALSIILGTVGTLLFFWSLSGILVKIMQRNKRLYFKHCC